MSKSQPGLGRDASRSRISREIAEEEPGRTWAKSLVEDFDGRSSPGGGTDDAFSSHIHSNPNLILGNPNPHGWSPYFCTSTETTRLVI